MATDPAALYLDLLKKTLAFLLWPEPPVPLAWSRRQGRWPKRLAATALCGLVKPFGLQLALAKTPTAAQREEGEIWPGYADTMIGLKRLDNIQHCVETALAEGIAGDLIETGVWRGGGCIFMRGILAAHGVTDRKVFVADSFAGLPPPDPRLYPADAGDRHHCHDILAVSREQVARNFAKYGLLDDQVVFLEGWFKDTLPRAPLGQLAVLRLDGDMYGSTRDALVPLYPRLSQGGFCIVDDYALPGCRQAVDDYRAEHGITAALHEVDWTGRYWRKS
ncbi:MAG: TylF/MycF family methyltransferase [Candidatus Krumholzibacteria bacterium]|jgi:O-methyltransferase|nr:TylF/MycF family methyltransferase [Candidatus Krumholzibacteria bacterium]